MAVLTLSVPTTNETLVLTGVSLSYSSENKTEDISVQEGYTALGKKKIFTSRIYRISNKLDLTNLSRDEYLSLSTFLVQKIRFGLRKFTVSVDTLDLGKGIGVPLSNCSFSTNSTDGLVRPKPPEVYDVSFPFISRRV